MFVNRRRVGGNDDVEVLSTKIDLLVRARYMYV